MSRGTMGFVYGILLGGIAGGITALLYTPVSGKKMRKQIIKKKDDIMEDMNDYYEAVEDVIKDGKKRAESIIEDARNIINI
ncbi:MAG: YtxH domain-containing protein [Ignavibacteria bacterium]|nr:YtxH domain-containing protein [Ignavibacteria bacterium]MCU7501859.1 YtxH domain-containing protein [Ignavibacteria bacterium]MCU7514795.1 YtxH domain-containing protein [Ignavibacteria bacterium]